MRNHSRRPNEERAVSVIDSINELQDQIAPADTCPVGLQTGLYSHQATCHQRDRIRCHGRDNGMVGSG